MTEESHKGACENFETHERLKSRAIVLSGAAHTRGTPELVRLQHPWHCLHHPATLRFGSIAVWLHQSSCWHCLLPAARVLDLILYVVIRFRSNNGTVPVRVYLLEIQLDCEVPVYSPIRSMGAGRHPCRALVHKPGIL